MITSKSTIQFNKKLSLLIIALFLMVVIIFIRLCYLQIKHAKQFTHLSQQNFLRLEEVISPRGTIFDCNNNALATNRPVYNVYWQGSGNKNLIHKQHALLEQLKNIIHPYVPLLSNILLDKTERLQQKKLLCKDINHAQLCQICECIEYNTNIIVETDFKRYYPYGNYASHIIGYLGNVDMEKIGKMGLEKLFETSLRGTHTSTINAISSSGKNISKTELLKGSVGDNIYLNLDITIQKISEQIFPKEYSGALIVMNPKNGAVVSILSRPHFDPSVFLEPMSSYTWQSLQKNNTFLNRALMPYPPGSIFKLVTISAALEKQIANADALLDCKGYSLFAHRKYWCARKQGHGILTTKHAVAKSCNVLFFEIGKRIDIDTLAHYAYKFGLGTETGSLLTEKKGLVPSRIWKEHAKSERWWPGETLSVSIGQSFLLTTPLQIARMIGGICTGYLVQPRFLVEEQVLTTPLDIMPETLHFLRRSMRSVVKNGTGKYVKGISDIEICAKTSTAQMSDLKKRHKGTAYFEHGWFASYFTYKNDDPLVLVILVEHAGSAQIATSIARNFLLEYKKMRRS